jgi:hypothetical protein
MFNCNDLTSGAVCAVAVACVASSRQLVQCVQSPGLTTAVACVANSRRLVQEKWFVPKDH